MSCTCTRVCRWSSSKSHDSKTLLRLDLPTTDDRPAVKSVLGAEKNFLVTTSRENSPRRGSSRWCRNVTPVQPADLSSGGGGRSSAWTVASSSRRTRRTRIAHVIKWYYRPQQSDDGGNQSSCRDDPIIVHVTFSEVSCRCHVVESAPSRTWSL